MKKNSYEYDGYSFKFPYVGRKLSSKEEEERVLRQKACQEEAQKKLEEFKRKYSK